MAVRMRLRHQDDVRAKISAGRIVDRLTQHVDGKCELSPTQIQAARILLDKSLPSLTASEHSGNLTVEAIVHRMEG